MGKVEDILRVKGSAVHSIAPEATVFDAVKAMVEANVGALLVTERDEVSGIITERDYLRRIAVVGRTSKTTLVQEIMTSPVVYVSSETAIDECMAIMTEKRIRHLPVVDEGTLAGIVSIGDLVKHKSKEQDFQIQYLSDYIAGR